MHTVPSHRKPPVVTCNSEILSSGLTSQLGLWLGRGAAGSIPKSVLVFCGGENVCVHRLCMGVGVHTALLTFTQLSSVLKGSNCVGELVKKLTFETILFTLLDLNITCTLVHLYIFGTLPLV